MGIYVALVEVVPLGPEALGEGVGGGFVRCYAPASRAEEALELIKAELLQARVEVVHMEWCVDSDEVEWENPESESANEYIAEARKRNAPVLGEFHVWGADEDGEE